MTALDTFFADIGAGGLSTAVVAPAPGTQGPATQLYGRLQEEINGVNDKTLSLLKDNWDDFKGQLKEGDELIKRLEEEERELKDLEDVVDGPDAFLPPLVEQLTSHQSLSAAHLLTTTSITLLSALLTFHTTTHALATATTSGDLPAAVDALRSVTSAVEEGAEDWIEETDVWKSLVRWAGEEESRLESAVLSALESCFEITPASSTNSHTSTLTLRERVAAAPGGPQLAVSTLFEAMEEFATVTGRKAQGEGVLQRLAKGVVRHFVAPFLEANGGLGGKAGGEAKKLVKPRLAFGLEEEKEEGVHVVSLSPVGEDAPAPKAKDALTDLSSFLAFFSAHSSLFPSNADDTPSKYATILTAHLTPPLQSHLISSHLSPSLPSSTATLPTYLSLLDSASKFESTFLPEHHYFAFLPFRTRSGGREVEEQRVIRSWAQRVPNHWAKAVGDEALAKIRTAVKGWDWGEGETVEVEVKEEEEMMGLLLGLGMAGDEDGKETGGSGKGLEGGKKPGQLALETVPKGAKREMTIEEATAPKPPRPKTPPRQPTPPPAAPPAVVAEPEPTPVLAPAPTGGKRGKLGAARIAPSVLPPRSPSPPPLFQGGDAPPPPSTDYAPSAAPASLPVPSEKTSTISLLSSSLSSPTSPDANLAATSTFSLLEKPLTSPSEIETTADLAPDEEVSRPHQYGSNAMRDGLEAAKKEEVEEEVKKEEDEEEKSEGKEEEEDRKPFIKQESVEPEPQGAPSESMLFGGRGDVGASPSFSPRVDVPPEQEREVREESLEPEVPPSQPATSFAAPLATAAHSPPAATTYSPPATTEVQQPEYGGYEPTPYQPPSPAQPVETFEQEEAEQGEEAAPYEPSRYEPTPYQPPTPYEPTPYQPPAPYEPTPYQPPEPEPEAEEQQQPKEEEQDDEVAPYEATSYEPTPYQPPAEQDQQGDIAPYEVEPYQPTPYEPTPYEPPADAVPDEAEQQYGGEPKEENDVAPYDPTPYQPSAYEPTPYREPTPPAQEEPVAQPEVEEQQHAYEPGAYQPHSYEPSSGYEPAAYESSGYQPEQQEQEKQAFEPGHQAFPSTASDDEYERAMREWQPSPAAQPENQQDSMPASSSTYESNAYQSSSYEPSAYEPQQEYQPEHRYEPEQQVQPQQPEDSHYQYGQSAQSWQPTSSPYDPPQQAASPAAPPVPVIVSPPPVLPPQPASAAAAPPPPRASAGFSSARPAVQQQRRVVSPSVTSPTSQPQNAYAPPSPARATPPRSTYPLSGPIFRPPSRPSSAQSQNNGPVLNHIQQRFASPPPGNHNPYVPLGVLAGGPPLQQQTPGGSYLPLNDPLFAGLLGSGSGSKPASSGNYFTPDPPGARLHRSGSVSSQTSNSSFSRGGAAGGGYRPSSSASNSRSPVGGYAPPQQHYQPPQQQQHYQPQQQHAYNAHSYNPNAYASQGGGYGVQEEVEELQDSYANGYGGQQQQYNPYAYGAEQPAMRLRGGAYLSDWEDEDEEGEDEWDEEDVEEDRPVLRLRGGADLGEMDDDDGNRSADDWGFGDDAGTGDVEEDAWGFGDEDEDASAPSPPPPPAPVKAPAPPPARATATTAPPVPTGPSHAPSASITSTTSSTGTLSRSRPPSYAFSPSLAPPPLPSSVFGGEVDEADEEGAGGDEWGFGDEDLEAPSPAVEEPVEAVVPPPRAATPPQPSPPAPASVSAPLAPAFSSPTPPPSQLVQTVPAFQPEAEPETVSPVEDVVDDWGFGAEDDAAPLEPVEDAQVVAEEPSDMLEYKKAIEEHDEVHEDPPMPTVADEVVGTEEAPVQEEQQVDEQLFSAPEPISAVRQPSPPPQEPISSVEAEPEPAAEDEGWGLDEEAADEAEPEQNEASVEEHAAPLVGAMEAQAPVISSPPLDTPSEVPSPVVPTRDLALDAFPLGTTETLPAEPDEPAPVEPAFAGVEFEVQPVEEAPEEPSPAAEPVEEPTAPSALTAPAAELTDPFPIEPKVEAPRLPTPQIPAPLPHHDVAEASMVEPQSTEEALQGVASAELDDANLFEAGQPEDDGWGLDGEEDEAVPTDLAPVESFLPDGKEAATQEHDVPIETSLLNPEPAMEDFADFTPVEHEDDNVPLRSPFQTQAAWEPFEEPSGVPVGAAAQPSPVHEDDEPLAPEEREAALNRAERLIEEEATVPNMARKELHELAATYPPTASSSREPSDPSIATREGTMSSPEVIEHSDAWGFDGDSAPAPAEGAEVLEASAAEPAVHDGEQDSVVQHEYARPALHDESAVEHVAHRPLVQPEDKDAAIVLPAHDAHPQERTFSPPPESVPAPAEEDDASGWDLGEEDASTPPQEAVEPERARQVEQAEKPASTAEEDWDFGSQQLDAQAAEVLEATETPAEEPAPPPASESAVQHISQRDVEPAEHSPTSPPPPVELAQPQQHTFSPSPSSLPAEKPYSAEAQQEPRAEEGWDFDASQADVPAAAEMLESTQASVEDAAPPPSDESAVQHISQRDVEHVEHDATSSPLPVELAQPQQHTFSPPPSALPVEEPVPAEPQEEEPAAAADEGWDSDAQQDDVPAAAEALESPQTAVEEAAPPPPAESAVQHISQRPVEPVEPAPDSPPLPAQLAQPQEHTFSPPPSAVPADDDAFADDPWDLDPVEPTPVSEQPSAAKTSALSSFAEETPMVGAEPEVEQQQEEDSWNFGEQHEAAEVLEADPEEQVVEKVPPPPPADESAVQHEQDRPVVETAPEETAAGAVQPQEHTFDIPPSAAPAEEPLARALSPQPPSPASEEAPTENGGDDGWGWDGEAAEEQASQEPVSAVKAIPNLPRHVDEPVPRAASPPPPSFAAPRAPSPPPVAPRSSPPPPALAAPASSVPPSVTAPAPEPAASSAPRSVAQPAPSASAPPTESAEADEWGWNDDAEDDSSKPSQPAPPAQQLIVEEVPKEVQPEEPEEPSPPPIRREKMMVSKRSKEIVKIAEEVLLEALKVASPSFEHPEFASATAPLLQTFVSLLSLYRATAAVHNSNLLASVPAIGMQFANDADWIGREVERIWREATEGKQLQVSEDQAMDVELAIQSTRQLGKDTRSKQVSIQRAALMESLDEAGGFLRTSDDSRYSACERALQQVTHTLQRLALVWKPVMTPTALYTTLGGLINEVLLRILDEIEDQDDISEEESIRLNALCKMLHELESLFQGSETSVGREVPVWFKFVFLSELLEASMADIMFLFSEQHLLDFTPQEIAKLMRALFADSALRNRNIEKVLQGHPPAAPDEGGDGW